ncbi:hypothetical protein [Thiolapillus sp.]|uniref:hypothetical protein n=1 Tax=Thiolapillus sp. TaxID=2017437 RepID=UPI003AF6EBD0
MLFLGLHGTDQGNNLGPLVLKVAVAQPVMVLGTGIDDPADGFGGDAGDGLLDETGTNRRGARADKDHPIGGSHKTESVVQPVIFWSTATDLADQGPGIVADLFWQQLECLGGEAPEG